MTVTSLRGALRRPSSPFPRRSRSLRSGKELGPAGTEVPLVRRLFEWLPARRFATVALAPLLSSSLLVTASPAQDPTPVPEVDPVEVEDPLDVELDRLDAQGTAGKSTAGKLLEEIEENMRQVEKLLSRKETGEESQSRQLKTVEQIEKLIEELNKT